MSNMTDSPATPPPEPPPSDKALISIELRLDKRGWPSRLAAAVRRTMRRTGQRS